MPSKFLNICSDFKLCSLFWKKWNKKVISNISLADILWSCIIFVYRSGYMFSKVYVSRCIHAWSGHTTEPKYHSDKSRPWSYIGWQLNIRLIFRFCSPCANRVRHKTTAISKITTTKYDLIKCWTKHWFSWVNYQSLSCIGWSKT